MLSKIFILCKKNTDKLLVLYIIAIAVFSAVMIIIENTSTDPVPTNITLSHSESTVPKTSLNHATFEELLCLENITDEIAKNIIEYRNENGYFSNISELLNVNGIDNSNFEIVSSYFFIENIKTMTTTSETNSVTTTAVPVFTGMLDLNTATLEELMQIPIITDEQAKAIIELRDTIKYFSHTYELAYAEGFSDSLVAELENYVYVAD